MVSAKLWEAGPYAAVGKARFVPLRASRLPALLRIKREARDADV